MIKSSWEIKKWVELSIPQDYVDWSEAHSDKFGKEYVDFHERDDTEWIEKQKVREAIDNHFVHGYIGDGNTHSHNCRMCRVLRELGL